MFYNKISMVEFAKPSNNSNSKITKKQHNNVQVKVTRIETNDINPQICKLQPYESQFYIQKPIKRNKKPDETRKPSQMNNTTIITSPPPPQSTLPTISSTLCELNHVDGSDYQMTVNNNQIMTQAKRPIIRTSISINELLN
ncbi:predicted protein [Naegleria gruberi]|uniref:Predicted protein n=1 Tax=Naegleria gruberi TaxID=5762 RepID=D2W2E4_NAEGR|nr:uncharacterized protein NAEGRDRAFT_75559 [Naegleria gruberi]EFC36699.1 predicted protein [Naegleria gruberi]|eukprot:XP_002669443.1 predicted protein [Naegleria gruberi strain NEG-M]